MIRKILRSLYWALPICLSICCIIGAAIYLTLLADLPAVDQITPHQARPTTQILDRNGRLLYELIDHDAGKQIDLRLDSVPQACINATLATEDSRFYEHPGLDLRAIARATWQNVRAGGEIVSGGSTLTQQLARTLLLDPEERYERSLRRKIREAWLAWRLEQTYTKDQLLALYLNQTYYGNFAFGLEAAGQVFFAKPAAQLSRAECALLAGLIQYPGGYNPLQDPDTAKNRQLTVLRLMTESGHLTNVKAQQTAAEPLQYKSQLFDIRAPHFVMYVQELLLEQLGAERLAAGGLRVTTTLDLDLQAQAERAINRRLDQLNCRTPGACQQPTNPNRRIDNAAAIILDSQPSSDILAMVGSPNYFDQRARGNVNASLSLRQPGSAIKPFTYAAALDPDLSQNRGQIPFTAASIIADLPVTFMVKNRLGETEAYTPLNYDRTVHGPVSLRTALASSYNIPAVKILDRIGVRALQSLATQAGISTFGGDFGLALTLGGGEVRLLELTAAFGIFQDGVRREPRAILAIEEDKVTQLNVATCSDWRWFYPLLTSPSLGEGLSQAEQSCSKSGQIEHSVTSLSRLERELRRGKNSASGQIEHSVTAPSPIWGWLRRGENSASGQIEHPVTVPSPIWGWLRKDKNSVSGQIEQPVTVPSPIWRGLGRGKNTAHPSASARPNSVPTRSVQPIIRPATAHLISHILADDIARAPAFGTKSILDLPFDAAAKTGTTTDWRDNWTVGYSTERIVGVWVGNADNSPMLDISGIDGAAPIWHDLMIAAHPVEPPPFAFAEHLQTRTICAPSGMLPTAACPRLRNEQFIAGIEPTQPDTQFQSIAIDRTTGQRANTQTPAARQAERVFWMLPPQYHAWMQSQGIAIAPPALKENNHSFHDPVWNDISGAPRPAALTGNGQLRYLSDAPTFLPPPNLPQLGGGTVDGRAISRPIQPDRTSTNSPLSNLERVRVRSNQRQPNNTATAHQNTAPAPQLTLTIPTTDSTYQIHPGLPKQNQRIFVEGYATTSGEWDHLFLIQNGTPFVDAQNVEAISGWWTLQPGTHEIWLEGQRTTTSEMIRSKTIVVTVEEFKIAQR